MDLSYGALKKLAKSHFDVDNLKPLETKKNVKTWKPAMKGMVNEIPQRPNNSFKSYINALSDYSNPKKMMKGEVMRHEDYKGHNNLFQPVKPHTNTFNDALPQYSNIVESYKQNVKK